MRHRQRGVEAGTVQEREGEWPQPLDFPVVVKHGLQAGTGIGPGANQRDRVRDTGEQTGREQEQYPARAAHEEQESRRERGGHPALGQSLRQERAVEEGQCQGQAARQIHCRPGRGLGQARELRSDQQQEIVITPQDARVIDEMRRDVAQRHAGELGQVLVIVENAQSAPDEGEEEGEGGEGKPLKNTPLVPPIFR